MLLCCSSVGEKSMNFNQVTFETSFGDFSQILKSDLPEIVFSGRSNVGKSSLINTIFNRKNLARVSSVPGKTTTINFFRMENVRFVDLPGYGYAKVSKSEKNRWSNLIGGYFNDDRDIALIMQLVDVRHSPSKEDMVMINFLIESELPFIIILTKCDKLSKKQLQERLSSFKNDIPYSDQITMIPFSSTNFMGVEEVRNIITEILE